MFGAKRLSRTVYRYGCRLDAQHWVSSRFPVLGSQSTLWFSLRTENRELRTDFGGADRDRTGGLLVANQALSQLSYSPKLVLSSQMSVLSY